MAKSNAAQGCAGLVVLVVIGIVFAWRQTPSVPQEPKKTEANISQKVQERINQIRLAFLASGCGLISDDDAEAFLTLGLHNARIDDRASEKPSGTSYPPYFEAKKEGVAYSQTWGACDPLKENPDRVALLRSEASLSKSALDFLATQSETPPIMPAQKQVTQVPENKEDRQTPNPDDYCVGFSAEACERIKSVVEAPDRPEYCKPGFGLIGDPANEGMTDEKLRICYARKD